MPTILTVFQPTYSLLHDLSYLFEGDVFPHVDRIFALQRPIRIEMGRIEISTL